MWQLLKEEGPLMFKHSLTGTAKAAAHALTVDEIGYETGLDQILNKLDDVYLTEKNQRIFSALDSFEKFNRPSNMSMNIFLPEFQKLYNKIVSYQCTYPDGVLAYRLLKA